MRVLVVDDEQRLAHALARGLRADGWEADLAFDGVQALGMTRSGRYDAVVLDIMLPRLSGYRVLQAVRAAGDQVPVLMLSAKDGEYDLADALDLGADDYLVKPFSYVVLLARLRALLRRGGGRRATPLTVGDLHLDPASRRVTRADTEVTLTPREFGVLEYLMAHAGDVVSKTDLLTHVWDTGDADGNVVEVYVGYLRRKIDVPFGRSSVQTVRGAGYRLAAEAALPPGPGPGSAPGLERGPDPRPEPTVGPG